MLGTILSAVGTGLSLFSQFKESESKEEAREFNVAGMEAKIKDIKYKKKIDLERLRQYKDGLIAKQRLAFAKGGVVVDRNTAMDIVRDSAKKYDMDVEIINRTADIEISKARAGIAEENRKKDSDRVSTLLNMGSTVVDFISKEV